jgi:hypothetical protein
MNNTEKKLDALIDALGFDVEEKHVFDNEAYTSANRRFDASKENYIQPEFKFTKRDKTVDDEPVNHEWTVDTNTCHAFDDDPVDGELKLDLWLTEAFKNVPYTARTTIVSSTILKRELLKILETAGKKPKKETIAIIEYTIDKAFKNE